MRSERLGHHGSEGTPVGSHSSPAGRTAEPCLKQWSEGTDRAVPLAQTRQRLTQLLPALGITRVANLTGLDRIGIPVVAAYRPASRSLSVAQGKGLSLLAAEISGIMESLELHHAERALLPLLFGSVRDIAERHPIVDLRALPRRSTSTFDVDLPLLWVTATELNTGQSALLPHELVHMDCRTPLPTGSGAFLMSSNGLASGNILEEATTHALCEVIERDANALWHVGNQQASSVRRLDLTTVDDPACRAVLELYAQANVLVAVWETTTDVRVPSFMATVLDEDPYQPRLMPPLAGSGCHPRKSIALLRALTEAAQARVTMISGARDDWSPHLFDERVVAARWREERRSIDEVHPARDFTEIADHPHASFEADVQFCLDGLKGAGLNSVWVVNLTHPAIGVPVVRVVVPGLESMTEVAGVVRGARALRAQSEHLP